jgi:predicted transcriptional regulator
MNKTESTKHLERVKDLHVAFKSRATMSVTFKIAKAALESSPFYPDSVHHEDIDTRDKNTVGSAYRMLANIGLIQRTSHFRRSKADGAKGRTIFAYELVNRALAIKFLQVNDTYVDGQMQLFG